MKMVLLKDVRLGLWLKGTLRRRVSIMYDETFSPVVRSESI